MRNLLLLLTVLCFFACVRRSTPSEVENNLKSAMIRFLENGKDTNKVKFRATKVTYFEDRVYYDCEFQVQMLVPEKNIDTVGYMTALISKDFETVKRKF
jgi:hypothetical protein